MAGFPSRMTNDMLLFPKPKHLVIVSAFYRDSNECIKILLNLRWVNRPNGSVPFLRSICHKKRDKMFLDPQMIHQNLWGPWFSEAKVYNRISINGLSNISSQALTELLDPPVVCVVACYLVSRSHKCNVLQRQIPYEMLHNSSNKVVEVWLRSILALERRSGYGNLSAMIVTLVLQMMSYHYP